MPCTYTGSLEGDAALGAQQLADRFKVALDKATAAACEACQELEEIDRMHDLTPATREWWAWHQAEERERIAKQGLAKLTAAERRALGLEDE